MDSISVVTDTIGNAVSDIAAGIADTITVGGKIVNSTDGMEKLAKFIVAFIDSLKLGKPAFEVLKPVSVAFKAFADTTAAFGIVERLNEFTDPKFWERSSALKIGKSFLLSGVQMIDTLNFFNAVELIKLGDIPKVTFGTALQNVPLPRVAAEVLGRLPILSFVRDGLGIGCSVLSLIDNKKKLDQSYAAPYLTPNEDKSVEKRIRNPFEKFQKWLAIAILLEEEGYLNEDPITIKKQKKNALEMTTEEFVATKVETWKVRCDNVNTHRKKLWIGNAYEVAKIALISLNMLFTAIAIQWTILRTALALTVTSIGIAKFAYDSLHGKVLAEPVWRAA